MRLVDLGDGRVVTSLAGHQGTVRCLDATADTRTVISGGMQDRILRVWNIASGRCTAVLEGHRGGIYCVALDRDGHRADGSCPATGPAKS